jgi:hypothetical protein
MPAAVIGSSSTRSAGRALAILLALLAATMLLAVAADTSAHDAGALAATAAAPDVVDHDATIDDTHNAEALLAVTTNNRTVRSATSTSSRSWLLLLALLVLGAALRAPTHRWHVVRSRPFADGAVRLLLPLRRGPPALAR